MNYFKDHIEEPYNCPERENFLDNEEFLKGYGYFPNRSDCIINFSSGECAGSCEQDFLEEITLYFFIKYSKKFGFIPFEKITEEIVDGKKIETKETVVGFYSDEDKHIAFIHGCTNRDLLPQEFRKRIEQLADIDYHYEGVNYLLVKRKESTFAFKIGFFQAASNIISTINFELSFRIKKMQVSSDGTLLGIIMDDDSVFIIAGLIGLEDYIDEERFVLTDKIDKAQPFFSFEPYKKVNWSNLKDKKGENFEALCEIIFSKQQNLIEIQSIGKTNASDRGRDFIIKERIIDLNGINEFTWLVQCKFSENSISPKTVPDWINRVIEHNVNGYWLVTNSDITPDLYDQLKDSERNDKICIKTRLWQRNKFDQIYNTHPELFVNELFT